MFCFAKTLIVFAPNGADVRSRKTGSAADISSEILSLLMFLGWLRSALGREAFLAPCYKLFCESETPLGEVCLRTGIPLVVVQCNSIFRILLTSGKILPYGRTKPKSRS